MSLRPEQIAQQLRDLRLQQRIIFIHPNFSGQHELLGQFFENGVYVRFEGSHVSEEDVRGQLNQALMTQRGRSDLNAKLAYVILDECDRVEPADLVKVLHRILGDLNSSGRVIVLGRVLPEGILADEDIRSQSAFVPLDKEGMLWDYAAYSDKLLLEVAALGEGRVRLNGVNIDSWEGALPRSLFFFLIDRGMVTRSEIFQTFWPGLSAHDATNVFHVTKRKITEVLGTELTVYGAGFYHISPKIELIYDVSLFNQLIQEAEETNPDALLRALALYRGDYLTSIALDWADVRRDALMQAHSDALIALARVCESDGGRPEALGYYLRASQLRPEREDAARASMLLYRDLGMPADALAVYQRLEKSLRSTLRVAPSPQLQQLAADIRASG